MAHVFCEQRAAHTSAYIPLYSRCFEDHARHGVSQHIVGDGTHISGLHAHAQTRLYTASLGLYATLLLLIKQHSNQLSKNANFKLAIIQ